ncbi:MAG: SDR family NAD(P)-dependent oxidoreductase [Phyllobacterium sp.]
MTLENVFGLNGERAVITGGGSGLGQAIAKCFIAAGAEVLLVGTDADKLKQTCSELGEAASHAVFDVTQFNEAQEFAALIAEQHGAVSILVNNAGNTIKKPVPDMTPDDFSAVMNVHVGGAYALSRAFLPQIQQRKGSVLFTASMSSFLGIPNVIGYSAAKSAYVGMVRAMATEFAPLDVRVNGVAPGWIDTALLRQAIANDRERERKINERIPMGRFGEGSDIGWAMTYLASKAATYVTGHIIVVDGGALHGF